MLPFRMLVIAALLAASLLAASTAPAATLSRDKRLGEPRPDQALVYLIREKRYAGSARTMFVYADQTLAGTIDNDSYTFAYLPPGKHLLWLNWTRTSAEVELEAGKTYYYAIWLSGFDALDEASGKAYIEGVGAYATSEPGELAKAEEHIRKRYGKAVARAAAKPDDDTQATALARRARHVAQWPRVDLAAYPSLCAEPFSMVDPKAGDAKKQYQVDTAGQRLTELVLGELGPGAFAQVRREPRCDGAADTLVLRGRITQYKPGSDTARLLVAGAGSAQIELEVDLVAAQSGQTLVQLDPKGTWAWGGAYGASKGIADLEKNVAYEVAAYLKQARGQAAAQ